MKNNKRTYQPPGRQSTPGWDGLKVLDALGDPVVTLDRQGRITYLNPAAGLLFSGAHHTLLGKVIWEQFRDVGQPAFYESFQVTKAAGEATEIEAYFPSLDRWLEARFSPLPDGLVVYFRDVSESRLALESLRASDRRNRVLFECAADGIAEISTEGRWIRVNQRLCDILGYSMEALLEQPFFNLTHPDDLKVELEHIHRLTVGEVDSYAIEKRSLRRDGKPIWTELAVALVHAPEGVPDYFIAVISDIDERKRIENDLFLAREDYRLLMEGTTEYGIIKLDSKGRITRWNTGAEHIFGYREAEVLGLKTSFFYTPEDIESHHLDEEVTQALSSGSAEDERWHLRKDGSRFWASGLLCPLYDSEGTLQGFSKIIRDNTERRLRDEKTRYLANHDPLTGLSNRAYFSSRLHEQIALTRRNQSYLALHLLDMDRFKFVNDSLGHDVGDLLLKEVAARLLTCVRETDVVARFGGDEFVVIQTQLREPQMAECLAQKIVESLGQPFRLQGKELHTGTSLGIAVFPSDGENPVQLQKSADLAMYKAKSQGRGNYQFFTQTLQEEATSRQALETDLRRAVKNQEFELYYQPLVQLESWRIAGVEALLRWRRSPSQLLAPTDFLQPAEEMGLSMPIAEAVLRDACQQNRTWQLSGIPRMHVAVNFSAIQFSDSRLPGMVRRVLDETGLEPADLVLEITEHELMKLSHTSLSVLSTLKELGVYTAIDDFGTGYSSLSYLKDFAIDCLKLDKSFIDHVPNNAHDAAITSAIIGLARDLGVNVVAEGVETLDQLAFLEGQGCYAVQGFLFSAPLEPDELAHLLREGAWSRMNPPSS